MKNYFNKASLVVLLLTSSLLLSACSDTTQSSVKLNAKASNSQTYQKLNSEADTVIISEAKFRFSEIEFESATDNDSTDIEQGPLVLSLNLNGGLTEVGIADVPAGFYEELEFEIEARDEDDNVMVNDPDFEGENGQNYSMVISGTINGEPFTFKSVKDFEVELEFEPAFEVNDEEQVRITLNFDTSLWFLDQDGNALYPTDSNNTLLIESNIENSIEAFEDDDEDGEDDED
jgi:hypothetical protein|tara:strand:+ start:81463 stop:82158 length:696 start_codon:yes stop_codon:yes gene_type:complete